MTRRQNLLGMFCALMCEVLFGFSFIFTKKLAADLDMPSLLSWRFIIAFAGINVPVLFRWVKLDFSRKNIGGLLLIGLFVPVVYFSGETIGVKLTTTAESSVMIACIPVVTLIVTCICKRCLPTWMEVFGFLLALIGAVGCIAVKGVESTFSVFGYLMLFVAVLSYPFYCMLSEKFSDISNFTKTYVMMGTGAVVFTLIALGHRIFLGGLSYYLVYPFESWGNMLPIMYLGLGCSVMGFFLFNTGVSLIGPNRTVSFAGVTTIVAIVAGVTILHEYVSFMQVVFSCLVIVGITITNLNSPERKTGGEK